MALKADSQNARSLRDHKHTPMSRWDKAVAACSKEISLGRSDAQIWSERGTAYGMLGQYESAAADFARAVKGKPDAPFLWYYHAMARFGADDLEGYHRVWAGMHERFGKTKDPVAAARLVHLFVLVAEAGANPAEVVQWGKVGVDNAKYARLLGHALYRDRQYEAAIRHFQELAKTAPLWGDDQLFLAMAQQRLGREDEARATFAKAETWIGNMERVVARGGYWSWYDQVATRRLHKEAEALFRGK